MNKISALLLMILLVSSCGQFNKEENGDIKNEDFNSRLMSMDASLTRSSKSLDDHIKVLMRSFDKKLSAYESKTQAEIWFPKAKRAQELSDELTQYINDLKTDLKKESGFNGPKNEDYAFNDDDMEASARLFGDDNDGKGKGAELENKLRRYAKSLLAIDQQFKNEFQKTLPDFMNSSSKNNDEDFTASNFLHSSTAESLAILSRFQNDVKNAEFLAINYFHAKVGEISWRVDAFSAVVSQSSNFLMPGEELEITAGLGAYSTANKPTVIIAGSAQTLDADGKASYKIKVDGAGSRSVPVFVRYYDGRTGENMTVQKEIKYTIGTPGGAAIVPDKMNVFYIGVDNPITISSPVGWDKTKVRMNNGNISGNGSVRIVRVNNPGNATITVEADGNPMTFSFRVKRIPDPVFKVGSGKIRMTSAEFKAQQYCRADLENFDFDLKYNVVGGNVYFSGANFPNVITATISSNDLSSIKQYMMKCGPGSCVAFDNIKVQGPDGIRTISGKSIQLY